MIYRTRGEHANHYNTDAVQYIMQYISHKKARNNKIYSKK
jgi:hypothetical protein